MKFIVILLFVFGMILLLNNSTIDFFIKENYVQIKSGYNINKNSGIIKPIQVTNNYSQMVKNYDRDDPVLNPHYSPNIIPKLLLSSNNLYLPGQSNGEFEQSDKSQSNKSQFDEIKSTINKKSIRANSGQLIRPIELDSSPSINSQIEKPYISKNFPQANSEYLEYGNEINLIKIPQTYS
jgi:hypothetical protein